MEKIKSILSPGKHVEDEIMYGSGGGGGGGQYEHTGREAPGSTGGYYGETSSQPRIYNRERDSIPSQPSTVQEYGKTEDQYAQAEKERAATGKVAREQSTQGKDASYRQGEGKQGGHRKQRSGEHKESRNPYTQQAVDPRLGEGSEAARNAQPQAYGAGSAPKETSRTSQGYEQGDPANRGGKGAAAAGLGGAAGVAGAAGAAGATGTSRTAPSQERDSPHGEVVGRTVSGNHLVERTASGLYTTRLASIIDPKNGEGAEKPESAYEHTPGGGGAYTADKFHGRESRVASITMPDGKKYTDPEADENYGLGYSSKLPSGGAYKAPAGSGVERGGAGAYERGGYGGQGEPPVATTKSEAARAVSGEQPGHRGAGPAGAGVAGAAVPDAYNAHPTKAEETSKTTTTHKADKSAKKSASKAVPPQRVDESAYAVNPPPAKYSDVEVPPGNDFGKGVKDPRYGLPMAAAGISASEAAALRRNEPNVFQPTAQNQPYVGQPSTTEQAYATQPTAANQAYATQPATQAEQQAARAPKEEKPSRRSSILGFLHLGKDKKRHSKDEKRHSKDEKRLSDQQHQPYTDRTGQAPLASVAGAGYGGPQAPVPGSVTGHGQPGNLAYRDRQASTADAPAFTGGLVGPNGTPLTGASAGNADSSTWAKSTEREVMDKGGMGQGSYGGGGVAGNKAAYGGTGANNQAAYGTGIDESYATEPAGGGMVGTGATEGGAAAQKPGSHGAATTGGAVAAGAAAGGLAAGGTRGSQANEGVASDYNMQSAQDRGAPTNTALHHDQVSPRSSAAAEKKAHQTNHKSNGSKEVRSNGKSQGLKEKGTAAYAGNDAQARDAAMGGYENDPQIGSAAQGGYGSIGQASNQPAYDTYGNGPGSSNAAYGGKEAQASNAAYGGGGAQNADETAFGNEDYVSNGTSHGTSKIAERGGHHVLHKDPPATHPTAAPAAAMAGVQ